MDEFHKWWDKTGFTAADADKYEAVKELWYSTDKSKINERYKIHMCDIKLLYNKHKAATMCKRSLFNIYSTMEWNGVTCNSCLKLKTSLKEG